MSYDNQAARKGQAINLAIQAAIASDKLDDNKYIIEQYLRFLQFASIIQKSKPEDLASAVDNPKFIELLEAVDQELNK